MLVLNIKLEKCIFSTYIKTHYFMNNVYGAVLKRYSVCIRRGTGTDGPAPAGPLSVYVCPIKSLHFIPLYHRTHLYPFLQQQKKKT